VSILTDGITAGTETPASLRTKKTALLTPWQLGLVVSWRAALELRHTDLLAFIAARESQLSADAAATTNEVLSPMKTVRDALKVLEDLQSIADLPTEIMTALVNTSSSFITALSTTLSVNTSAARGVLHAARRGFGFQATVTLTDDNNDAIFRQIFDDFFLLTLTDGVIDARYSSNALPPSSALDLTVLQAGFTSAADLADSMQDPPGVSDFFRRAATLTNVHQAAGGDSSTWLREVGGQLITEVAFSSRVATPDRDTRLSTSLLGWAAAALEAAS